VIDSIDRYPVPNYTPENGKQGAAMRITMFAAGSRGDIQPCVVLCAGLQRAGYRVRLAAPADFAAFVGAYGVDFHPLRGNVQEIMASETGRDFMETGGANPLKSIRAIRAMIGPVIQQMADDAFEACRDADALICLGVLCAFGQSIAEALHIPILDFEPTPLLPTGAFPAPSWPVQRNLGRWHNYMSGRAMLRVIWMWYRPFVNDFRRRLGLAPHGYTDFFHALRSTPMLSAYSTHVIPHPMDWPATVHITGYLFPDGIPDWQPPPDLTAFLDAGDPPVYVGFGSMGGSNPEELAGIAMKALLMSGRRGVLVTGWGGLRPAMVPEQVFVVDSAPHGWLFPRMAAVVHHGGAGTTAEGLRAGCPSIIVPFAFDQPFWGARIAEMGLGPAPIPKKALTADRLAHAIRSAVSDSRMKQRAGSCGRVLRAENGLERAVAVVKRYLGEAGHEHINEATRR
jgi:sterol 3beta-glucosyltransferase